MAHEQPISPRNGINVLICGAGTAGLMAALECWRKGRRAEDHWTTTSKLTCLERLLRTHH